MPRPEIAKLFFEIYRPTFYELIEKLYKEKDYDTLIYLWDFFKEHEVVCDTRIRSILFKNIFEKHKKKKVK